MSDRDGNEEFESIQNPWFETESGDLHFIAFQVTLEIIWRYAESAARRLDQDLASIWEDLETTARTMDIEPLPDEVDLAERLLPTLAFGSAMAAALTALECLLIDLCSLIEDDASETLRQFTANRAFGSVENCLAYLSRYADFEPEIPKEVRREFDALRGARNRFAHQLGAGTSPDLAERIEGLTGGTAKTTRWGGLNFTIALVETALATVGRFGRALEDAFIDA